MSKNKSVLHSFYAVLTESGSYFKGFDPELKTPILVEDIEDSKLFSNKFDVKLRPTEKLVEVVIDTAVGISSVSEPFRPRFPKSKLAQKAAQ